MKRTDKACQCFPVASRDAETGLCCCELDNTYCVASFTFRNERFRGFLLGMLLVSDVVVVSSTQSAIV